MLDIEQSQPRKLSHSADVSYLVVGYIELNDFGAFADRRDDVEGIELQFCILYVDEVLNALEVCDGLKGKLQLLQLLSVL